MMLGRMLGLHDSVARVDALPPLRSKICVPLARLYLCRFSRVVVSGFGDSECDSSSLLFYVGLFVVV
jgi:hypothetical protein